jgi:hypothetical protein
VTVFLSRQQYHRHAGKDETQSFGHREGVVQKNKTKDRRDDLCARYRLTKTPEDKQRVIRDMQRFNMEARKYRGIISPITTTSLRQAAFQRTILTGSSIISGSSMPLTILSNGKALA